MTTIRHPKISVLFVTKNGEQYLPEVLEQIARQRGNFTLHEIIAVDSGSRDQTLAILHRFGVKVIQIPPSEFSHGRTRNLAVTQASGDYAVFLTQDATPANNWWLEKLLSPLLADPSIVGAYSRHLPRPNCHPMEWRRITEEELSGGSESRVHTAVDNPDYLHFPARYYFFTDVSSIRPCRLLNTFPMPDVAFGEDQLWAKQVLEAGYKTSYCADSLVYHSHSYGPWANLCRHFDHAYAMQDLFHPSYEVRLAAVAPLAWQRTKKDLRFWSNYHKQGKAQTWLRWGVTAFAWHAAALFGYWLGERKDRLPASIISALSLQEQIKRR